MRKHSVRKFIHAVLDCLPLMVIPIFAIYSQNHEINDNTLQVQENKVVDLNQLYKSNFNEYSSAGITITPYSDEGKIVINGTLSTTSDTKDYNITPLNINYIQNHIYVWGATTTQEGIQAYIINRGGQWSGAMPFQRANAISTATNNAYNIRLFNGYTFNNVVVYPQLFDLTQMFGSGNEPTLEKFRQYLPNNYYEYTLSEEFVIENYETITYDDTDIMSQFMYVSYNACDKYFNMNRVFNLGGIWNWVSNTLFGGQPPLSAFIVYNVIAYEFIMDIIFLIYMVFMFLMDFAESCLDNAFYKSKRGINR